MKRYEKTNKEKSEQLGMSFGKACGRLRRIILFDLLRKHKENVCYRCKEEIKSVSQLSIEHKIPWFKNDTNLFWDLDNISFSHLSCNIKSTRRCIIPKEQKDKMKLNTYKVNHVLSDDEVIEIKRRVGNGETLRSLGKEFGVHHSTIGKIKDGRRKPWFKR